MMPICCKSAILFSLLSFRYDVMVVVKVFPYEKLSTITNEGKIVFISIIEFCILPKHYFNCIYYNIRQYSSKQHNLVVYEKALSPSVTPFHGHNARHHKCRLYFLLVPYFAKTYNQLMKVM